MAKETNQLNFKMPLSILFYSIIFYTFYTRSSVAGNDRCPGRWLDAPPSTWYYKRIPLAKLYPDPPKQRPSKVALREAAVEGSGTQPRPFIIAHGFRTESFHHSQKYFSLRTRQTGGRPQSMLTSVFSPQSLIRNEGGVDIRIGMRAGVYEGGRQEHMARRQ